MMPFLKNVYRSISQVAVLSLIGSHVVALSHLGISPQVHGSLRDPAPRNCAVRQDGETEKSFSWTHVPVCVEVGISVLRDEAYTDTATNDIQTLCTYTNANFNLGRGISLVTTPETAAELAGDVFTSSFTISPTSPTSETRQTEGKGIGLFAKSLINAGDTVTIQTPVLMIRKEALKLLNRSGRQRLLERAVEQLPNETQKSVLGLSRRDEGKSLEIEDVVNVNSFRARVWDGSPHLMVVPEPARINHACRPNAYYRFDDYSLKFDAFALKKIQPGEEITFCYGHCDQPHEARLEALETTWGFRCTCPLCTAPAATLSASDSRLAEIAQVKEALPTSISDIPQYIAILPHLISLLEDEGLLTELPMYEEILAYAWSALMEEDRAKLWAGRARRGWEVLSGKESVEARRVGDLEKNTREHFTWGSYDGGDPWEGVGMGHPWDEKEGDDHHDHE